MPIRRAIVQIVIRFRRSDMTLRNTLIAATVLMSITAWATAGATGGTTTAGAGAERERTARFKRDELTNTGGWTLQSANTADGAGIAEVRAPGVNFEMTFTRDDVSASGGCNQLRGEYTATEKRLEMTLAIVTRMACTDEKNLADRSFSEQMSQSFKVELLEPQPYRMRLTGEDGIVLVFQAKPIPL
jgi:heat shock protein HslJ